MRLSTIFLLGVLCLLTIFVAGVVVAERLQSPSSPLVHFLRTAYAPTFITLKAIGTQGKDIGKNRPGPASALLAGGLLLLTPVLYSGLIVAGVAALRRKISANKRLLRTCDPRTARQSAEP